ncbi:hypothetical protein V6N11_082367 [Hibiscus sabdariffa]|uniref:Uncharacterized protein n=1 Tax=Hibiscus sabdariffa TaxID=183260 RepID=A0ABR2PCF0_9ROSI
MGCNCKIKIYTTLFLIALLLPISLIPPPVSTANAQYLIFEEKIHKKIGRSLIYANPRHTEPVHPGSGAACGFVCT